MGSIPTEQPPAAAAAETVQDADTVEAHAVVVSPSPSVEPADGEVAQEVGGPSGPEPTRFGDWERKGRCIDF